MAAIVQALEELQQRVGWLPEDELKALAKRLGVPLHRVESISTFYTHFRREPGKAIEVSVCRDLPCMLAGGRETIARLREKHGDRPDLLIREVSCLGRCEKSPVAHIAAGPADAGICITADSAAAVDGALAGERSDALASKATWAAEIYESSDQHYGTLRDALGAPPAALASTLEEAGLRGMGGAGFPTGRKWRFVAQEEATPKTVICNADESEPGTFKDRQILADLPHLVIEGMALGAFCIGAKRGIVFIRHEYEAEREALATAIEAARRQGVLGERIFGSDFSFDVEIFVSPGGYILGEESALLECLEDRRGEPRNKPPFPGTVGLHALPTLINNVETFAHASGIIARGVAWWRSLGTPGFSGHKFLSVSGDVAKPGVLLVPTGTILGEILERCGGMREGVRLGAIAPGGASSNFLPADRLDIALDFEPLEQAGSMLGSGAVVFVGDHHDLLDVGINVARFFRNESCGKCVPCRVGSEKAVVIADGAAGLSAADEALLLDLHGTMQKTSICGLGQVALAPLVSILARFPERIRRR